MFKKKYEKLKKEEQKRIFNIYIHTNKIFQIETLLLVIFLITILLFESKNFFIKTSILFILVFLSYLYLSMDKCKAWYNSLKNDPLKNKEAINLFRTKEYFQLNNLEKTIVQQEYKKSESYNIYLTIMFYIYVIESILLLIKKIISINSFIYNLLIILLFLLFELHRMKEWYKKKRK